MRPTAPVTSVTFPSSGWSSDSASTVEVIESRLWGQ